MGHTTLGAGCRIHSHAVVGDAPQDLKYHGDVSFCRIGEGSVVREGATVHRGTLAGTATVIGKRCLLMTNSHVGHNCELSDDVILVSGSLLGWGMWRLVRAIISGNAAVHQHVRIGELVLEVFKPVSRKTCRRSALPIRKGTSSRRIASA